MQDAADKRGADGLGPKKKHPRQKGVDLQYSDRVYSAIDSTLCLPSGPHTDSLTAEGTAVAAGRMRTPRRDALDDCRAVIHEHDSYSGVNVRILIACNIKYAMLSRYFL